MVMGQYTNPLALLRYLFIYFAGKETLLLVTLATMFIKKNGFCCYMHFLMRCKCINSFGMVKLTWKTFCSPKIINIIYLCVQVLGLQKFTCRDNFAFVSQESHTHTIVLITK